MPDIDFTSKELARIIYHMDESTKKKTEIDWKARYEKLMKEVEDLISDNTYSKAEDKEHVEKLTEEDEELKWKLKVVQKQVHKDETDLSKDDEDWDEP